MWDQSSTNNKTSHCFLVLLLLLTLSTVYETHAAICPSIDQLIHSLPFVNSGNNADCQYSQDCTSVSCTFINKGIKSSAGLVLKSCDVSHPRVLIKADIPTVGIQNWTATFGDQSEELIPGYFLPAANNKTQRQGYLKAELKKSTTSNNVILGLMLKGCEPSRSERTSPTGDSCILKQILRNQELSCDALPRTCSLSVPFQCAETETCSQTDQELGECLCRPGLIRQSNGTCSLDTLSTTTKPNPMTTELPTTNPPDANKKDSATLAVNIAVPLLIMTLVAALTYAAVKQGLYHRLRAGFRRRRLESVVIEDDDDDAPLA